MIKENVPVIPRLAWDRFVDTGFRFEIDFPMDWKIIADSDTGRVTFREPERSVLWLTRVTVRSKRGSGTTDINHIFEKHRTVLAARVPGYVFIKSDLDQHPCGSPVIRHTYREFRDGVNLICHEMLMSVPGELRVYTLRGESLDEKFPEWEPAFDHIFDSFSFSRASGKWVVQLPK